MFPFILKLLIYFYLITILIISLYVQFFGKDEIEQKNYEKFSKKYKLN